MDINSFKDLIDSYIHRQVVRSGPGQTYGPAQSRYTRTPEQFVDNPTNPESGHLEVVPHNILTNMIHRYSPSHAKATIVVNPLAADNTDMSSTLRHEDTHALLRGLTPESYNYLAGHNPAYSGVATRLLQARRAGFLPQEAPAYMVETDPYKNYDIPSNLRDLYISTMQDQLTRINAPTGRVYGQLARMK